MKESRFEYLLAFLLEPLPAGSQFIGWPLHITLVPSWFRTDKTEENVLKDISQVAARFKPMEIRGSVRTYFGWREEVPVTAVVSPELHDLHRALYEMLEKYKYGLIQNKHMGADYQPHVTKKGSSEFKPNHVVTLDRIYLVKAPISNPRTRTKTVVGVVEL